MAIHENLQNTCTKFHTVIPLSLPYASLQSQQTYTIVTNSQQLTCQLSAKLSKVLTNTSWHYYDQSSHAGLVLQYILSQHSLTTS